MWINTYLLLWLLEMLTSSTSTAPKLLMSLSKALPKYQRTYIHTYIHMKSTCICTRSNLDKHSCRSSRRCCCSLSLLVGYLCLTYFQLFLTEKILIQLQTYNSVTKTFFSMLILIMYIFIYSTTSICTSIYVSDIYMCLHTDIAAIIT